MPTSFEGWILISVILNGILGALQVIIDEEAERRFEKVIASARLNQGLLQKLLADSVVRLDHFGDHGVVFDQNGQVGPLRVHLVGLAQLVIDLVQPGGLFVELSRLLIVVILFELVGAVLAHGAGL